MCHLDDYLQINANDISLLRELRIEIDVFFNAEICMGSSIYFRSVLRTFSKSFYADFQTLSNSLMVQFHHVGPRPEDKGHAKTLLNNMR